MNETHSPVRVNSCLAILCILSSTLFSAISYSQSSQPSAVMQNTIFTYSIIESSLQKDELLERARRDILMEASRKGGVIYATWSAAAKPTNAPFAGLEANQLGLMLAWPKESRSLADAFVTRLESIAEVSVVSSRLFDAIYLPFGLSVPTGEGFYVHREAKYAPEDEDEVFRLSEEAWVTWEPRWEVTVIGLFRELETDGFSNLNRIVWYPSYEHWRATRDNDDEASATRFRQRRALRLPDSDSGIAIATDRTLP